MSRNSFLPRLFSAILIAAVLSCSREDGLKKDCIMAEYVSVSESHCGGSHKIKILKGIKHIKDFYPGLKAENGFVLTTNVPQELRIPGTVFYLTASPAKPRICTAEVMWYTELEISNVSRNGCL